jgi:hypothetical protein
MFLASPGSSGAAQRTFVASYGSDANPCSLTAPCRGFAAAVAQTSTDGEVIVLDSAGYGTVTIAQSVSIIAPPGVYAGISVFSGDGITVGSTSIPARFRTWPRPGSHSSAMLGVTFATASCAPAVPGWW